MPTCKFTRKPLSSIPFYVFCLHFSENMTITSFEDALKECKHNFFQWKVVLLVIYLFNYSSSKSTFFMLNMAFDVLLSTVFVKQIEFFVSCNITRTSFFLLCILICTKNLIVLNHGDNNFLFWHLYQIHTFNNNLNDEGMIVELMASKVNWSRKKKSQVSRQIHLFLASFRKLLLSWLHLKW